MYLYNNLAFTSNSGCIQGDNGDHFYCLLKNNQWDLIKTSLNVISVKFNNRNKLVSLFFL